MTPKLVSSDKWSRAERSRLKLPTPVKGICITENLEPFNELPIVKKGRDKNQAAEPIVNCHGAAYPVLIKPDDANDVAMTLQRGRIGLFRLYDLLCPNMGKTGFNLGRP